MPSHRWESEGRGDNGVVAVETAIVSMLLFILLVGVIESSLLFKDYLVVASATRAGARMGASQPRVYSGLDPAYFAQLAANQVANASAGLLPANLQQVWVYKASAVTGLPDSGSFASCNTCVKFTWSAGALTPSYSNWPASSQDACSGDVRDSLGVYVQYKHPSPLGFFFNGLILNQSTVMLVEPTTAPICK